MDDIPGKPKESNGTYSKKKPKSEAVRGVDRSQQQRVADTDSQDGNGKDKVAALVWWKKMTGPDWVTAVATVFIAIATCVYAYYAGKQWEVMSRTLKATNDVVNLTREQIHTGQRAYLEVDHMAFKNKPIVGEPTEVTFELKNTGQTPALEIRGDFRLDILAGEPGAITYNLEPSMLHIGAGQTRTSGISRLNPLKKQEFDEVTSRDEISIIGSSVRLAQHRHFCVWGMFVYKDVFGGQGKLEFCGIYVAAISNFIGCKSHHLFE